MSNVDERKELERLFKHHRSIPFPPSHSDEAIQAVHDHLIVYDAEVAGLISRILEGDTEAASRLMENAELRDHLERLIEFKREAGSLLRLYLEKYDRLSQLIELGKRISRR